MNFTYLKGNCPICAGARRDCRQSFSTGLFHCRDTEARPTGFTLIGEDAIGFRMWADSTVANAASEECTEQRRQEREARRREVDNAKRKKLERLLPVEQRDREIRRLFQQLGLSRDHQDDLHRRGLSDTEINRWGFRSFSQDYLHLSATVSPKLAGIQRNGRYLTCRAGMAIPCYDTDGRITGWQLAPDDKSGGKYTWPNSASEKNPDGPSSKLPNGEMPIQVARVPGARAVGMIEGILKPLVAASLSGFSFVGASGGLFLSSRQQVAAALAALTQEIGTRTVAFYPDKKGFHNPQTHRRDCGTIRWVRSLGYDVKVAYWGQWDGTVMLDFDDLLAAGRGGEIQLLPAFAYLAPDFAGADTAGSSEPDAAEYAAYEQWLAQEEAIAEVQAAEETFEILQACFLQAAAHERKIMHRLGFRESAATAKMPVPVREYTPGARIAAWQQLQKAGYKYVLDLSACGTGKSHTVGIVQPEDFGAHRVIYISPEHRNPTTATLAEWSDLEARHNGLFYDAAGKLRRRQDDSYPLDVLANCGRTKTLAALRDKAITDADLASTICTKCPHFEACGFGAVYGYRHDRFTTLEQSRFRAHPASLPHPAAEWYSENTLFWDESASFPVSCQISVTLADIKDTWLTLLRTENMASSVASGIVETLYNLATGKEKTGRWGLDIHQLRERLSYTAIDYKKEACLLAQLFAPDLSVLDFEKQFDVSLADLPAGKRKRLAERDEEVAKKIEEQVYKQWLLPFLAILSDSGEGYASWQAGKLTLTLPDRQSADIARAAKLNVILDATGTVEEWAAKLGISTTDIAVCRQAESARDQAQSARADVKWHQIGGIGRLGMGRTDGQNARAKKAIAEIKRRHPDAEIGYFDFKKFGTEDWHNWFVHSRGINDLKDTNVLILVGAPQPNIASLAAEFTAIYGREPEPGEAKIEMPVQLINHPDGMTVTVIGSTDEDFQQFCHERVCHEVWQAAERLRASRRLGEELHIYFLSEYPLPWPVKWVEAAEFCPEAASQGDMTRKSILNWIASATDIAIKSAAVAVGCTKAYLSKLASEWGGWANFTRILRLLINGCGRLTKSIKAEIEKVNQTHPEVESLINDWLPLLLTDAPAEVIEQVTVMFTVYGREVWPAIVAQMPNSVRVGILSHILASLPPLWAEWLALSARVTDGSPC